MDRCNFRLSLERAFAGLRTARPCTDTASTDCPYTGNDYRHTVPSRTAGESLSASNAYH